MIGAAVCIVFSILCVFFAFKDIFVEPQTSDFAPTRPPKTNSETTVGDSSDTVADTKNCPVDFESLQKINNDIYAWIDVPGTNISYPIVQSSSDDAYYLTHDCDKNYSSNGALFTEKSYNSTDFEDPVTVIYGHDMISGKMFGQLQADYSNPEFLAENDEIIVYTPDRELHYTVFAATPYYSLHLLHYYPFDKSYVFNQFFDELFNYRGISSTYITDEKPVSGDKVIVLSTCMNTGSSKRFLVMGVLKNSQKYN